LPRQNLEAQLAASAVALGALKHQAQHLKWLRQLLENRALLLL
jgi:hypothetical protein